MESYDQESLDILLEPISPVKSPETLSHIESQAVKESLYKDQIERLSYERDVQRAIRKCTTSNKYIDVEDESSTLISKYVEAMIEKCESALQDDLFNEFNRTSIKNLIRAEKSRNDQLNGQSSFNATMIELSKSNAGIAGMKEFAKRTFSLAPMAMILLEAILCRNDKSYQSIGPHDLISILSIAKLNATLVNFPVGFKPKLTFWKGNIEIGDQTVKTLLKLYSNIQTALDSPIEKRVYVNLTVYWNATQDTVELFCTKTFNQSPLSAPTLNRLLEIFHKTSTTRQATRSMETNQYATEPGEITFNFDAENVDRIAHFNKRSRFNK